MAIEFQRPSDFIIKSIKLINFAGKSVDLSDMFYSIDFTESIFDTSAVGSISIIDGIDLIQYFPIIGEETLEFSYTTDDTEETPVIDKLFRVYRVSQKEEKTNDLTTYRLHFVSVEELHNSNIVISRSYKGMTVSQIVADAFNSLGSEKQINIDETVNNHHVIIPRWHPIQTITWMGSIARSPKYEGSLFLFYENANGYNFNHIESLIDIDPAMKFKGKLASMDNHSTDSNQTYPDKSIVAYKILNTNDTLSSISDGMYASRTIAYDNVSKQIREFDYDYMRDFDKTIHMSKFPVNTPEFEFRSSDQRISSVATKTFRGDSQYHSTNMGGDTYSERMEESAIYRSSMLSQLMSNQIELGFYGDTRITAGIMIDVELPNRTTVEGKRINPGEKYIAEKIIITKVTNSFSRTQHGIQAVGMKDSVAAEIVDDLNLEKEKSE